MAKALVKVKLKPKDGSLMEERWSDGSVHEVRTAAFLTVLQGTDGRPPYVVLEPAVREALVKGGFKLDNYYLNVYLEEEGERPAKRPSGGSRKAAGHAGSRGSKADAADDLFDDDE